MKVIENKLKTKKSLMYYTMNLRLSLINITVIIGIRKCNIIIHAEYLFNDLVLQLQGEGVKLVNYKIVS